MKTAILAIAILAIAILATTACSKLTTQEVTVIRDCTGTYLRHNNSDYLVCNIEAVEAFESNQKIQASYKSIEDCKRLDTTIVCYMYHEHEGMIQIEKVKP